MAQFTSPFAERLIVAPQTAFNLVPNSTGVWDSTGYKLLRAGSGCQIAADPTLIPSPVKTGTREMQPGIAGRKSNNTWTLPNIPIIPSGTGGTPPDINLVLQSIFGAAPTGSVYALADGAVKTFLLGRFQHGLSTLSQQFAIGCITTSFGVTINQGIFSLSANGQCFWVLDSENFANEDTEGKAGLTAFPLEPSSPTVLGVLQQDFLGTVTVDGNNVDTTTFPLISAGISGDTGIAYSNDAFGGSYGALPSGGRRMIRTRLTFQDCDSAYLNNLKVKAKSKSPINITYQIGTGSGTTTTILIKGVQLSVPRYTDEASRVVTAFADSGATASGPSAVDTIGMTFA